MFWKTLKLLSKSVWPFSSVLLLPLIVSAPAIAQQATLNQPTTLKSKAELTSQTNLKQSTNPAEQSNLNSQVDLNQPTSANPAVAPAANTQDIGQVTSVNQLSDVRPTDWAYEALSRLVENYGCIAGYPDGTFRGNRALTRFEFAAGLNACLDALRERIGGVNPEDLEELRRLTEEFRTELTVLRGRVDVLEARTSELEANQFSTTTRLAGEIVLGLHNIFTGDNASGDEIDSNAALGYRVRLNLETSFTGRDLLTTRLQANNIVPLGGTNSYQINQ